MKKKRTMRAMPVSDRLPVGWKYLSVRRQTLFIEESLYRGTQWIVFEPNDEALWSQIRLEIGAFMKHMFSKGAFKGTTPKKAYFVKCDRDNDSRGYRQRYREYSRGIRAIKTCRICCHKNTANERRADSIN